MQIPCVYLPGPAPAVTVANTTDPTYLPISSYKKRKLNKEKKVSINKYRFIPPFHTHVTSLVPPLPLMTHMKYVSIQHDKAVYALHFTHLSIQVMMNTSFRYAVKKTRLVFVLYNVLM
jgi:hypothetical protein